MMEKKILKVKGMSCEHCVKAVNKAAAGIAGVENVTVNLKKGTVSFKHDPAIAPLETIKTVLKDEGYETAD
jgi:copper chaperone